MPGWTSVPGLDMDDNVGMHDCLAAAEWTSKYIHKFGGDPNRITVMGQSAGGGIINLLTTLKGGKGTLPFQQVIHPFRFISAHFSLNN
jgi:carboxylesterase type B